MRRRLWAALGGVVVITGLWAGAAHRAKEERTRRQREEVRVTIRAVPQVTPAEYGATLALPVAEGEPIQVYLDATGTAGRPTLPTGRELTFTLWRSERSLVRHGRWRPDEFYVVHELETVSDGGTMYYDARICPNHQAPMTRQDVDIAYGLPAGELIEAYKTFSGGPGFVLGGCVVSEERTTTRGYVCPRCVAAYAAWERDFTARRAAAGTTR